MLGSATAVGKEQTFSQFWQQKVGTGGAELIRFRPACMKGLTGLKPHIIIIMMEKSRTWPLSASSLHVNARKTHLEPSLKHRLIRAQLPPLARQPSYICLNTMTCSHHKNVLLIKCFSDFQHSHKSLNYYQTGG